MSVDADVMHPLAELTRLEQRLAAIETPRDAKDELKWTEVIASLVRALGLGLDEQNQLAEHRLRVQRRGGKLIPESGIGKGKKSNTLLDLGIQAIESSRWQQIANLEAAVFEGYIEERLLYREEITTAGLLSLRLPKPVPEANSRPLDDKALMRFSKVDLPTATIVSQILRVAFPDAETALDATYGSGAFWDGSQHVDVVGRDSNPWRAPDGQADFTSLPYDDDSFDVVLFDPPHIPDAGAESVMGQRYGTYRLDELEQVIRAGTRKVWDVSRLGVVVKVTDHSHGEYIVESDWVRESLPSGLYDVVYQVRSTSLMDPRWDQDEQRRAYNNGSTYLVFRKRPRP